MGVEERERYKEEMARKLISDQDYCSAWGEMFLAGLATAMQKKTLTVVTPTRLATFELIAELAKAMVESYAVDKERFDRAYTALDQIFGVSKNASPTTPM